MPMTIAPKLSSEATLPRWLVKTRTERPPSESVKRGVHAGRENPPSAGWALPGLADSRGGAVSALGLGALLGHPQSHVGDQPAVLLREIGDLAADPNPAVGGGVDPDDPGLDIDDLAGERGRDDEHVAGV